MEGQYEYKTNLDMVYHFWNFDCIYRIFYFLFKSICDYCIRRGRRGYGATSPEEEEVEPEDQKREMGNPILEVSKGKRAVSIKINLEEGVSGYIEPESKVDIMAFEIDEDAEKVSQTAVLVLENVKVLASGKSPDSPDEALRYETVTVEVTPEEGLVLGLTAKYKDGFYLMLRNDEDTSTGKKGLKETKELLKEVVVEEEDGGDEE